MEGTSTRIFSSDRSNREVHFRSSIVHFPGIAFMTHLASVNLERLISSRYTEKGVPYLPDIKQVSDF